MNVMITGNLWMAAAGEEDNLLGSPESLHIVLWGFPGFRRLTDVWVALTARNTTGRKVFAFIFHGHCNDSQGFIDERNCSFPVFQKFSLTKSKGAPMSTYHPFPNPLSNPTPCIRTLHVHRPPSPPQTLAQFSNSPVYLLPPITPVRSHLTPAYQNISGVCMAGLRLCFKVIPVPANALVFLRAP
ncbi:hypothetical protein K440DRAFT_47241 [Wilcoxina mikolae CBS 423.85]|nr:hypothetical protein K440DRAFT_47241 [Wilcoxina mikolae CBS 423.85]